MYPILSLVLELHHLFAFLGYLVPLVFYFLGELFLCHLEFGLNLFEFRYLLLSLMMQLLDQLGFLLAKFFQAIDFFIRFL